MLKGKIILGTSLALSAILACCVAVSCNRLQHEQQEPSQQFSTRERFSVVVGEHGQPASSYGEGKTEKGRMRSLVMHSVLSVEQNPGSRLYAALHSDKGLLYVVQREDVPRVARIVARSTDKGIVVREEK